METGVRKICPRLIFGQDGQALADLGLLGESPKAPPTWPDRDAVGFAAFRQAAIPLC
jgi:hypothetical protein